MAKGWVVRGVPSALAMDGWWLTDMGGTEGPPVRSRNKSGLAPGHSAVALLAMVVLGDFLFFGHAVGLSLVVFAVAVFLVAVRGLPFRRWRLPLGLLALAALPVVEHVQALSLAFLGLGLILSLIWARGGTAGIAGRGAALLASLPLRGVRDFHHSATDLAHSDGLRIAARAARGWAFPAGGALVLAGLLLLANPLLAEMLAQVFSVRGEGVLSLGRLSLWLGLAMILWPLIAPLPPAMATTLPTLPSRLRPNARSVARGLLVFNAILAVQTAMDAAYLWGGASLPEGMTAAAYAHRGAYPLLVTALLAGGFALAARPFAREDRRLRGLLLLWLAQNVALALSALLRLELYVEAFGLTFLRLHSAIWMALVAAGLGLTAWQVWRDRSNLWLMTRTTGLALATLYACCFINFAAIIATENLSRDRFDAAYVCSLGPTAAAAINASSRMNDHGLQFCGIKPPQIDNWRDWGFRDWRVRRYLVDQWTAEAADEDSGRG